MFDLVIGLALVVVALVIGGAGGAYGRIWLSGKKLHRAQQDARRIVTDARTTEKEILLEAKEEAIRIKSAVEAENREHRVELQRQERRVARKEEEVTRKAEGLERRERNLNNKEKDLDTLRGQIEDIKKKQLQEMERISALSEREARELLLQRIESEVREEGSRRVRELEMLLKEEADARAREIIAMAVQRCAADVATETTVSVVPIPSDDMKGRIIGREGRNIRALENATGCDLIIDDTPDAVTLSGFDPVRREVARVALSKLILDGRIHPARIEEVVQKAKAEVEATIKAEGEQAAYEAGVAGLHPELIKLLGRLKYRFSYGQNMLAHSLEAAHLAGMIGAEIGANVEICKKAGLLHDIGKAVDHEVEGTHAQIGADIVKRFEKSPEVIKAIAGHHLESDWEVSTVEEFVVAAADAISGARPGARRESLDHYLKRLEALESVANSFDGVEKSFAIQAGREVRIMVKPDVVDDLGSFRLARDIVKKIEESLVYPGQIKVTVVRETRAVEYAK